MFLWVVAKVTTERRGDPAHGQVEIHEPPRMLQQFVLNTKFLLEPSTWRVPRQPPMLLRRTRSGSGKKGCSPAAMPTFAGQGRILAIQDLNHEIQAARP